MTNFIPSQDAVNEVVAKTNEVIQHMISQAIANGFEEDMKATYRNPEAKTAFENMCATTALATCDLYKQELYTFLSA